MAKTVANGGPRRDHATRHLSNPRKIQVGPLVGSGFLNMITTGLYNDPLSMYREYLQNSADAMAGDGRTKDGAVTICIDPEQMSVRIQDNGPGLSAKEAVRALVPIARSQKVRGRDLGFRGIGRLSGLTFAQSVTFMTRAFGEDRVSRVVWDGNILRQKLRESEEVEQSLQSAIQIDSISAENYPQSLF